jgi:GPH family glycoside/pentoside/hexuronide:cation symporter
MAAEMTRNYHARTILMTYRTGFMMTGGFIAASSFALVQWLGNDRAAHAPVALIFGAIMFLACYLCFVGTASAEQTRKTPHSYSVMEQVRSALSNRPYIVLLSAKLCQLFGISSAGATAIYFKVGVLKLDYAFITSYIMIVTIFSVVALPVWARASKAAGKRDMYMVAAVGYALVTLTWWLAAPGDPNMAVYVRGACLGFCAAGILILGPALLPDTIEYDYLKTGLRREGIFASFYTTMEKLANAIGPSVILLILGWFGYESGTQGWSVDQPESAISAIYACAAIIPAVLCLLSVGILYFYDLSEKELERLRHQSATHSI